MRFLQNTPTLKTQPERPTAGAGSRWLALGAAAFAAVFTFAATPAAQAIDDLVITEIMAENDAILADEDGDFPDWIEIYNAGTNAVNLANWCLTDNAGNLTKWRFPATNLNVNSYLVVFASGKDRRIAGRPLHTSFQLNNSGEYVGLIKSDGLTVVSAIAPVYPRQAADISYGVSTSTTVSSLLAPGATGRLTVPINAGLGTDWTMPGFNDGSWIAVTNGVGYEDNGTAAIGDATVVADSLADWSESGQQGYQNWYYGAWVKTNTSQTYTAARFTAYPSGTGPHSTANFWDGSVWRWFDGNPPFDIIARDYTKPSTFVSGTTNGFEHQVIRRWVSEITGPVSIEWRLAKKDPFGGGVTGRVFHNNTTRDTITLTGNNVAGTNRTIATFNVVAGDTIDFLIEPGTDVVGDDTFFSATIRGATTLAGLSRSDVGVVMSNINASAYLRLPFTVNDPTAVKGLKLRLRYDDGFVAYLNGTPIAAQNAPETPAWNSTATAGRADSDAAQVAEIDLSRSVDLLLSGANVLALQGLNQSATDGDFLLSAELEATRVQFDPSVRNYFLLPTPGSANGTGTATLGALITDAKHEPHEPADNQDLYVTARIIPTFNAVTNVTLYYRVMFGAEASVRMLDDGLHADGLAGDGVYGAVIPNSLSGQGEMVRYYIVTADAQGNTMREPPFSNPTGSSQYLGAVVQDSELTNNLPVLHFFATQQQIDSANSSSTVRAQASLYYLGEFYDNVGFNRHGQSSSGFPKKSYDIDFNSDHHFRWRAGQARVDDINLLTTYPDKSHMRNILGYYGTYAAADATHHYVELVRVQTNGGFYGTWCIVENGDADFLQRIGKSDRGALYKMYNTFTAIGNTTIGGDPNAEKKTRKEEGNADLVQLFNGITSANLAVRTNYIYDNINIAATLNQAAARILTSDIDCCHKNYYFYRDTEGTGEWEMMPWDIDLSFGRNWSGSLSYWDDAVYPQNGLFVGGNNGFMTPLFNFAPTRQMYLRRVRTLMDELQQTNGTPTELLHYERIMDEWQPKLAPDAALDLAKWGSWGNGAVNIFDVNNPNYRSLPDEVTRMKTNYMRARRAFVFDQKMNLAAEFPNAQPTNVMLQFGGLDYNPASGSQDQEYIELINPNSIAVDISGWTLSGAIDHRFQGGVVIPSNSRLYVVPNKRAFRARTTGPRGGQGLYVEGEYKGQLSARGESIILTDKYGRAVSTNTYTGNPSPAQSYLRVTEIMYHPPAPAAGSPYLAEDFEYIELRNIGPDTLNLAGVRFVAGIEFSFSGSAITSLAAGQRLLVVRNAAAFSSRYGPGLPIAGQFIGSLDNSGENLRLDDAVGEKILDFDFNNSWYPITDGPGASLVIVSDTAPWNTWGLKTSWRPSSTDGGSPGGGDTAPVAAASILVNEILTHTDLPAVDQIELYNPTAAAVDLAGWFLSDDFTAPKKYRIPAGKVIPAGGYLVFSEADFNVASSPTAFSLSSTGDEVYLFSGDGTNLTGYFHGFAYGAAANGVTFGRHINSQTNTHFVAMAANTIGAANSAPRVGPVVISEINYRPVDLPGAVDNNVDEYLELANITGSPVPLFDPANPGNTWRLRGGVEFNFPANVTIPANGHVVLVNFNPTNTPVLTAFRSRFNVPASVAVFGPLEGQLSNSGEELELRRPDAPNATEVPYIVVDTVAYSNQAPWPAAADGIGPSLQRTTASAYGNDPLNWTGVGPSPGSPFTPGGTAPVVTRQPANTTGVAGKSASFSVGVSGSSPFFYQWRFNGVNLYGANNSVLLLNNLSPAQAGQYSCIIFNSAGSTESAAAGLTVFFPPSITAHPADVKVRIRPDPQAAPATNATFTVSAASSTPLRYQWLFNGEPIPGATTTSFTVTNVQESHFGQFVCAVTDDVDTVFTLPATLYPMVTPIIRFAPASQTVPVNSLVSLGVNFTGFPPPFTNEWRRGSAPVVTNIVWTTNDVIAVVAPPTNGTVTYRAVIKNVANPTPGVASVFGTITAVADTDGDGIADTVETALGLNPNNPADGAGDLDGDTMSNQDEVAVGTDPQNPASYLRITQAVEFGTVTLSVAVAANRSYSVQYTDDVASGQWSKLGDIVGKPTDRIEQLIDRNWSTARFYRVIFPGQP